MIGIRQRSTQFALFTLLTFLLAGLPMAVAAPMPLMAQEEVQSPDADGVGDDEIVYIDGDGFVRVLDTFQAPGDPEIRFVSPDRGWESVALGDFNGDGDMEIVAVGGGDEGDNDDDGQMAIWDPVPAGGGGTVELYRRSIDGKATMVAAGNFDDNINADEILFGYLLQDEAQAPGKDELFRITVIKGTSTNPDGREWTDHIPRKDDGNQWNYVTVGNVDAFGTDEVALLDEEGGEVNLYRLDDGFNRIWGDSSSNDPYRGVAIGDFYQGGTLEVAVSRNMNIPGNLYVYRYDAENDTLEGDYPGWNAFFRPYPRFLWPADIDGNSEDELFFLRRDQDPRLVGLNYPPKNVVLEGTLNDDDFRVGVGGDFDADGRDEIAIASSERILIYTEIETGNRTPIEYGFTTDRRSLQAGDLDASGGVGAPNFGLSQIGGAGNVLTSIDVTIAAGEDSGALGYYILNLGSEANVSLEVTAPNKPTWLTYEVNTSISGETDAGTILGAVYTTFNATGLAPGAYQASLVIRDTNSPSQIANSPLTVPVALTVEPAALVPVPNAASFVYVPCPADPPARSIDIRLGGLEGLNYSAAVMEVPDVEAALAALAGEVIGARIGKDGELFLLDDAGNESRLDFPAEAWTGTGPALSYTDSVDEVQVTWPSDAPWVTANSESGMIPDVLTLAITPASTTSNPDQAVLIIVADRRAGNPPANVRIVPIQYLCAAGQVHLPIIER